MNKRILITIGILTGVLFTSCKNSNSENKQTGAEASETAVTGFVKQEEDDHLAKEIGMYIATKFMTDADLNAISEEDRKFQFYKIDLNGDGSEEVFVNFGTTYFCGSGGCTVLLLNSDMELITKFSPTQTLYIDKASENGWKVLYTNTNGSWRKLVFDGSTYPTNPTLEEATTYKPGDDTQKTFKEDADKQKVYTF